MESHQPAVPTEDTVQAVIPAGEPTGFVYRRPERLERARESLLAAGELNENGSPIRAVRALIDGMSQIYGLLDRREFLRQRRRFEGNTEAASPRLRQLMGRVDESTVKAMLLDGGRDKWISDLTGANRVALRVARASLGLQHERRGGNAIERREQRKAFEAKWRPIVFGRRAGSQIQA